MGNQVRLALVGILISVAIVFQNCGPNLSFQQEKSGSTDSASQATSPQSDVQQPQPPPQPPQPNPPAAVSAFTTIQAENFSAQQGAVLQGGNTYVGSLENGDILRYNSIDFGTGALSFTALMAVPVTAAFQQVELRIDSVAGPVIGTLITAPTPSWTDFTNQSINITTVTGVHDLYLIFRGTSGGIANVDAFIFKRTALPAPTTTQVLTLESPRLTGSPGQTLTFTTRFIAKPMDKNYFVFVHFLDTNGVQFSDGNADYDPGIATMSWNGPITQTRNHVLPAHMPKGFYTIRIGLYENIPPYWGRPALDMGSGVVVDDQFQYTAGILVVN